jgi:hypothetical protein
MDSLAGRKLRHQAVGSKQCAGYAGCSRQRPGPGAAYCLLPTAYANDMPGVGFEPTCPNGARAFKAPLYASSSTRALRQV